MIECADGRAETYQSSVNVNCRSEVGLVSGKHQLHASEEEFGLMKRIKSKKAFFQYHEMITIVSRHSFKEFLNQRSLSGKS